jgi:hypothetical protein
MEDYETKRLNLVQQILGRSDKSGKRFFVIYKDKQIDFGSNSRETFFDKPDRDKRKNWYARHSTNINKRTGRPFIQ